MNILPPVLGSRILLMLQIVTEVNGWVTYMSLYNQNKEICVENNDEIDDWNKMCAKEICRAASQEEKTKQNKVRGEFFFDTNQLSDRNLSIELCDKGCPSPSCRADNTTCKYHLKICCLNQESPILDAKHPNVTAQCPSKFSIESCRSRHHMTYHECVDSDQIGQFEHAGRYFWTSSYITTLNIDNIKGNGMRNLNVSVNTSKTECFEYCLNLNSSTKVYYIAFNSSNSEETCQCFTRDPAYNQANFKGKLYAVRNKTGDTYCDNYSNEDCIAVVYQNSTVSYSIKNCSSKYASLCGPELSHPPACDRNPITSTSSNNPFYPSWNQDSPIERDTTTTEHKAVGNGISSDSIKIIVLVVSLLMFAGFLFVTTYVYSKRKNRRSKHVERARPNSISNRTYQLQQNTNTDEEELYTSITETADALPEIRRPLLPPRNKMGQDHIFHEMEYSTPSDAVSPSIDIYTDTYDNPLRKATGSSGEALDTPNINKDNFELSLIGFNKHFSSDKETNINLPSESLVSIGDLKGADGGYEITSSVIKETSCSSHNTNPYFTLTKQMNSKEPENQNQEDQNVNLKNEGDNSDYEDISVINGDISFVKSKPGFNVEQECYKRDEEEKSLLCTLSPYLLKELNIRIVPDNNEYAVNVIQRKSSSNVNLSNLDPSGRDRERHENVEPEADYDRLGYVERVMNAGRKKNLYNHVVLNQNIKEPCSTPNRRGTI